MKALIKDAQSQHPLYQPLGLLTAKQVLEVFPVSRSGWYLGVKNGQYPKPVKLGERRAVWRAEDIRSLISNLKPADDYDENIDEHGDDR